MSKKSAPLPPCHVTEERKDIYRDSTLGQALQQVLDEMTKEGKFGREPEKFSRKVWNHFDIHAGGRIGRTQTRMQFKMEEVPLFKEVNKGYEFLLRDTELQLVSAGGRDKITLGPIDKIRVTAVPASNAMKKRGANMKMPFASETKKKDEKEKIALGKCKKAVGVKGGCDTDTNSDSDGNLW